MEVKKKVIKHAMEILDSGERHVFKTGAVRDIYAGKGRCDLLPLHVISGYMSYVDSRELLDSAITVREIIERIHRFMITKDIGYLYECIAIFERLNDWKTEAMLLELSIHYEQGAIKYGERNWERVYRFIIS